MIFFIDMVILSDNIKSVKVYDKCIQYKNTLTVSEKYIERYVYNNCSYDKKVQTISITIFLIVLVYTRFNKISVCGIIHLFSRTLSLYKKLNIVHVKHNVTSFLFQKGDIYIHIFTNLQIATPMHRVSNAGQKKEIHY